MSAFRAEVSHRINFPFLDLRCSPHGGGAWLSRRPPPPWIYSLERRCDKRRSGVSVGGKWSGPRFSWTARRWFSLIGGVYRRGETYSRYAVALHIPASATV
ncbi:hypothetical protein Bca4012_048846 [Brassica carinata]